MIEGQAAFVPDGAVHVNGTRFRGRHYLIATGSRPVIPAIEGLDEVPYLTSDLLASGEEVELRELPRSLVIVGGGYIALELGQMFQRFGTQVAILERGPRLLQSFEPEAGLAIMDALGLEHVGVRRDAEGFVIVDAFLRTTAAPNI